MTGRSGWKPASIRGKTLVSYSQNAEDVRLARVFESSTGFYVDVGAGDPMVDSITKLFYDRGWSGVNVEPGPAFERLARERPRDVNLKVAVASSEGVRDFWISEPQSGLSTLYLPPASAALPEGFHFEQQPVECRPMWRILKEHVGDTKVDFMAIDVEGAEGDVIRTMEFDICRPSVLVVEAVRPLTYEPTEHDWEPILRAAGYELAAFDGINRFYVEQDQRGLIAALAYPISPLDSYVTAVSLDERERFDRALYRARRELAASLNDTSRLVDQHKREIDAIFHSRTWRAGRALVASATPMLRVARRAAWAGNNLAGAIRVPRRVPRTRAMRPLSPAHAYSEFVSRRRGGYAEPEASTHSTIDASHAARLLAAFGGPEVGLDVSRASELADELRLLGWSTEEPWRLGWSIEDPLRAKRLSWREHRSLVETESIIQLVIAQSSSSQELRRPTAPAAPPTIVVDARCLQGSALGALGSDAHGRCVLDATRAAAPAHTLVLLTDPGLPDLDDCVASFGDEIAVTPFSLRNSNVVLFIELSPFASNVATAVQFLSNPACATAGVVYDLVRSELPPSDPASAVASLANRVRIEALRHYDLLLPVTMATEAACRRILGEGIRMSMTGKRDLPGDALASELSVKQPFVLARPAHDSVETAAAVIAMLACRDRNDGDPLRAVAIGSFSDADKTALQALTVQLGLDEDAFELRSNPNVNAMASLIDSAELVVESSFSEGFAGRAAEAVCRGTPVVASDLPAHRDQLGAGPWLTSANDVEALAKAVAHVRLDKNVVIQRQQKALGDCGHSTDVRGKISAALESLLTERRGQIQHSSFPKGAARPRLAVLSPFPPQSSEVGDYTAFTFREVAKYADIEIYSSAPSQVPGPWSHHPLSTRPYLDGRFDGVINVISDAALDERVLDLMAAYGGTCIAHDIQALEAREPVFRQVSPLVVHARTHADRIREHTGVEALVLPFVPENVPETPKIDRAIRDATRRSLGLADDLVHVATFRQDDQVEEDVALVVGALSWLKSWNVPAHLHVFGYSSDDSRLLGRVAETLRLDRNVTVYDDPHQRRLGDLLLAIDVAVELRAQVARLSRVAADCIAFGLPTVASSASVDVDAPGYVATVGSATSTLLVAEAIESLRHRRRDHLPEIDNKRREWLTGRSANTYAQMLLRSLGVAEA